MTAVFGCLKQAQAELDAVGLIVFDQIGEGRCHHGLIFWHDLIAQFRQRPFHPRQTENPDRTDRSMNLFVGQIQFPMAEPGHLLSPFQSIPTRLPQCFHAHRLCLAPVLILHTRPVPLPGQTVSRQLPKRDIHNKIGGFPTWPGPALNAPDSSLDAGTAFTGRFPFRSSVLECTLDPFGIQRFDPLLSQST